MLLIPKRNERSSSTLQFLENPVDSDSDSIDYQITQPPISAEAPPITLKDSRINILSKKIKQVNLAYQNEKTKNSSLSKRISELEAKLSNNQEQTIQVKSEEPKQGKISSIMRKLEEERGLNQRLKLEVKALQKIVQRETGKDHTKIQEGSWKGRQEQIHILKDKIKELEQNGSRYDLDSSAEKSERKIDVIKRREILKVSNELETATQDLKNFKLKYDASAARIKNLEFENKDLRAKLQILLAKNANDDKLIGALQSQITKIKIDREKKSDSVFENLKQLCVEQEEQLQKLKEGGVSSETLFAAPPFMKDKLDSLLLEKKQQEDIIFDLRAKVAQLESLPHKERKNSSSKVEVYQDEIQGLKGFLSNAVMIESLTESRSKLFQDYSEFVQNLN
jgi:hypothetical protein